jgi:hypothetical protein
LAAALSVTVTIESECSSGLPGHRRPDFVTLAMGLGACIQAHFHASARSACER